MYEVKPVSGGFTILSDGCALLTPMGKVVATSSEALARRLATDLETVGPDPSDPTSIVAFHYASLDFFDSVSLADLQTSLLAGFDPENDWTFECPTATPGPLMEWIGLFGTWAGHQKPGQAWIRSLGKNQLCATTVLGRAVESVNIPLLLATTLKEEDLSGFVVAVLKRYPYYSRKDFEKIVDNFLFYYGLDAAPPEA